jgi:hypothetical protein
MISTLRTITAFLRGKTISNRGCDISRADAARIQSSVAYS